jgi:ATP/maltotriose-dependent transcriptional regulator MalT
MKITTDMLIQMQIAADVVLLIALLFFFRFVSLSTKKKERGLPERSLAEFKQLLEDSKRLSEEFVDAIDAGRKSLKDILRAIDEREKHLSSLIEKTESLPSNDRLGNDIFKGQGYQKVLDMAAEGISNQKIADLLDLTEGEVKLILNLHSHQRKNIE